MNARSTLAWSLRRELWEHRAVYIAPLIAAGLALLAFVLHTGKGLEIFTQLPEDKRAAVVALPYSLLASVILFTSFVVALFYCLDALYAERRDRSILFWKSMPVSDRATVLSKMVVPMAILPVIAFVLALTAQLALLAVGSVILAAKDREVSMIVSSLPLGQMTVVMFYGLVVHALWYAPIYGWLLLLSAWAKRAPFLWAVFPVLGAFMFEKIAFGTSYFFGLVKYRVMGATIEAFAPGSMKGPITSISQLDPVRFLATPGLWLGLVFAAGCLWLAIRMRRSREPI